ncbi:MAG: hypothetical protein HY540_06390, partial [Deltaproteobacteria bacterium]|nr:hypothetical protein [Deltaproteobacteria bacterium]
PYAYVLNNPLKYIDPTGHFADVYTDVPEERGGLSAHAEPVSVGDESGTVSHFNNVFSFSEEEKARQMELAFEFATFSGGLSFAGEAATVAGRFGEFVSEKLSGLFERVGRWWSREVTAGGTEIVQRAMSRVEFEATLETGLLRGGREGTHYVSDAVNSDALRAQQRLSLEQTPEMRVELEVPRGVFSSPSRVQPFTHPQGGTLPGGGTERTAVGNISVRVLMWWEY